MDKLKTYMPWAIALTAVFSMIWGWYHPAVPEIRYAPDGTVMTVYQKVSVPIRSGDRVKCPEQGILTSGNLFDPKYGSYTSPNMPPASQEGQNEAIIASGHVPASTGGYNAQVGLNTASGEASIWVKPEPRSLFGFENGKEIGFRYDWMHQRSDIFARWTFVRVGSLYGSFYGEISNAPDSKLMAELSYRW